MRGKAVILRGVPGSGKTTRAKELLKLNPRGVIHSTDEYFMEDGVYHFDRNLLAEFHNANYRSFCRDMRVGVPLVICDNCNIHVADFIHYIRSAEHHKYEIEIVPMRKITLAEAVTLNSHGVPEELLARMITEYEEFTYTPPYSLLAR